MPKRKTKPSSFLMGAVCSCLFPAGGKLWRLKYRFQAKEKLLTLGAYPDISLKDARKKRDAKELLAKDIDPAEVKREAKATAAALELEMATTFEAVAREWLSKKRHAWTPGHQKKIFSRLENQLFPILGAKLFSSPEPGDFLAAIQKYVAVECSQSARVLAEEGKGG